MNEEKAFENAHVDIAIVFDHVTQEIVNIRDQLMEDIKSNEKRLMIRRAFNNSFSSCLSIEEALHQTLHKSKM